MGRVAQLGGTCRWRLIVATCVSLLSMRNDAAAVSGQRVDLPLRGKNVQLTVYRPAEPPSRWKGTIIMGSGDVGWVGLAVSMSEFLSDTGYVVVGLNVRQYLSAFTRGSRHLTATDVPDDYARVAAFLKSEHLLKDPVILSGVSEGAALAVLGASSAANHTWASGVITMGLPATAALAWRWSDFTTWITKKDADEPSFAPKEFIAGISPLPLWMIQSTKDEYVPEQHYRELEAAARAPKTLVLIDASNHRFTDRIRELREQFLAALRGIQLEAAPHP